VNKSLAWIFFYGVSEDPVSISGIGFILYFTETHRVNVKEGKTTKGN